MRFFPRETLEWHVMEPGVLRRLSISLVSMAILAGVVLRLVRLASLHQTGVIVLLVWTVRLVLLAVFVTLHLGNFPLRQWVWRAPAFGLVQSAASLVTSAAFVAIGMERLGSTAMGWAQWRTDILPTVNRNVVAACAYALLLAAGVSIVRRLLAARR